MIKVLVSYFSATGNTKKVAEKISSLMGADLFEIEPVQKYTKDDLDWTCKDSRSTVEMNDVESRPLVAYKVFNIEEYDIVVLGFPVWWYVAPRIINTFIEENNLKGKRIYVFVTSGSTNYQESLEDLRKTYPDLNFVSGKRFKARESEEEYTNWIK